MFWPRRLGRSGYVVALLFSATWCPPAIEFCAALAVAFRDVASRGQRLRVVLVSSDRDEEQAGVWRH